MRKEYHSKNNYPPLILLRDENKEVEQVTKVGIIPFLPHAERQQWKFMLMKPHVELGHPAGTTPDYQIAKGTRRINMGGGWCDMREDDLKHADPVFYETLVETALREGREEIGLKPKNIRQLFDVGVFSITSARRGNSKPIHIFAAQMHTHDDFGVFESKTAEVVWMTAVEFASVGRPDHIHILNEVYVRLEKAKVS